MKTLKKSLAMLLALVMCLGCISLPAFADGEPSEQTPNYVAHNGFGQYFTAEDIQQAFQQEDSESKNRVFIDADFTADIVVSGHPYNIYLYNHTITGMITVESNLTIRNYPNAEGGEEAGIGTIQNTGLEGKYPIYHKGGNFTIGSGDGTVAIKATGQDGTALYVTGNKVYVEDQTLITGNIETAGGSGTTLGISGGKVNGSITKGADTSVTITGGSFKFDPTNLLTTGYTATQKTDGFWDVEVAPKRSWDEFERDTDDALLLKTKQDIVDFRTIFNTLNDTTGKTFRLANDIDMDNAVLGAAGSEIGKLRFNGTFDGANYTISNLMIQAPSTSYVGFLGVAQNATIKDVTFDNITVEGASETGGVVGYMRSSTTISNVHLTGTISITGTSNVGGIAGWGFGGPSTVTNSSVRGNNNSTITGQMFVGGLIGTVPSGSNSVTRNVVDGVTVNAASGYAGGLVGRVQKNATTEEHTITGNTVSNTTIVVTTDSEYCGIVAGYTFQNDKAGAKTYFNNTVKNSSLAVAGVASTALYCAEDYANEDVVIAPIVAKIGNSYYTSLEAAIADVPADGTATTITMVGDIENLNDTVVIPHGKKVALDLNGHFIETAHKRNNKTGEENPVWRLSAFQNFGVFTLLDSVGTGSITSNGLINGESSGGDPGVLTIEGGTVISEDVTGKLILNYKNSSLTIKDGVFRSKFIDTETYHTSSFVPLYGLFNDEDATVVIDGGTFECINATNSYTVYNGGLMTINGGIFKGANSVLHADNQSLTVNGGSFESTGTYCLFITNYGAGAEAKINGGMFKGGTYGVYENPYDKFNHMIASKDASIEIKGGTFTGNTTAAVYSAAADEYRALTLIGGTYSTDPSAYVATGYYAVKSDADGNLTDSGDHWTVVKAYTVKFVNWDGKVLQSGFVGHGATPTYSGTPTRTADASNTYTFTGWSPAVVTATGNTTYTATFTATPVANSNVEVTVSDDGNTVTVKDSEGNGTKTTTDSTTGAAGALNFAPETKTSTVETIEHNSTTSATVTKTVEDLTYDGDSTYTYTVKTATKNGATAEAAAIAVETALSDSPDTSTTVTLKAESTEAAVETKAETVKNATLEAKLTTGANDAAANVITTDKVSSATLGKKMTDLAEKEEITGEAVTVDVTLTLETKLTDYAVESGAATTVTYDVKPVLTTVVKIDGVQQGEAVSEIVRNEDLTATEAEPITVKLPIPATFGTSGTLQIKHLDDSGNLKGYILGTIKGNSTNGYYVEFTVTEFSSFEIVPAGKVFVTFDANGGNAVAGKTVTKNAAIGDLPAATRSGSYRFDGWFTAQTGGTQISAATTVSESTTYFAHWTYTGGSGSYTGGSYTPPTTTITDEETPLSAFPIFYVDVAEDSWYHDAVAYVTALDLMNGVGDDRFDPNANTTRGMVAVVMMRLAQGVAIDSESFFDVADDAYYAEAAAWAVENGVYEGFDDGSFRGELNITREQFAAVLYRYATAKGYDVSGKAELGSFTDSADVSGYAADAMAWAVESGIIEGVGDNLLDPLGNATRAQLATMLMRFHALYTAEV